MKLLPQYPRRSCYILLISLSGFIYSSQGGAQVNYTFSHLTSQEGLLDDTAYRIFEDSKGFFWFGTAAGIQRYDGYRFQNFTLSADSTEGLQESLIRSIYEMSDGSIWIGTQGGGISIYQNGEMRPLSGHELSSPFVEDILEDKEGNIWIATWNGVNRLKDGEVTVFNQTSNNSISSDAVFSLAEGKDGSIWIGTRNGLIRYQNGYFRNHSPGSMDSLGYSSDFIHDILVDPSGAIWLAIVEGGVVKWNEKTGDFERFVNNPLDQNSLGNDIPLSLALGKDGSVWAVNYGGGLNRIKGQDVQVFLSDDRNPNTLSTNNLEGVMVDRLGNIWIASNLGGVSRCSPSSIQSFPDYLFESEGGVSFTTTSSIIETSNGEVWISTFDGVNIISEDGVRALTTNSGSTRLSSNRVDDLHEDRNGRIWLVTQGSGIDIYENGEVENISLDELKRLTGVAFTDFDYVTEDGNGNIWIGGNKGLLFYNGDSFRAYTHDPSSQSSITNGWVKQITIDAKERVWIATLGGGISMIENGLFENFDKKSHSLPSNSLLCINTDDKGFVWAGYNGGVFKLNPSTNELINYTIDQGLSGTIVESIIKDAWGGIWIATHNGLSRYNPDTNSFDNFDKKDGLFDHKLKEGFAEHKSGSLLFVGPKGYYRLDPKQISSGASNPILRFTDFNLLGQSTVANSIDFDKKNVQLNYDESSFKISFSILNAEVFPSYNYEYRLLPSQEDWTFNGNQSDLSFTQLSPGKHELQVRSRIHEKEFTESFEITIRPPWWETPWFRLTVLLSISAIVLWIILRRRAVVKANQAAMQREIDLATSEIRERNDELTAQGNNLKNVIEDIEVIINKAITEGNFSSRIDISKQSGEWQALVGSMNQLFDLFAEPFKEINAIVDALSRGNLTRTFMLDCKGDILEVKDNFNQSLSSLSSILKQVSDSTEVVGKSTEEMVSASMEIKTSSSEIAQTIASISSGASKQVIAIDNSSAVLEKINVSSKEIGERASEIKSNAEKGVSIGETGLHAMESFTDSMKEILASSGDTKKSMQSLMSRTMQIEQFLTLIQEVSTQINLLSLNASIVAAHAGDAGKGFSVIAGEIGTLADGTKSSIKNIEDLVKDIQSDTKETEALFNFMSNKIEEGEETSLKLIKSFQNIAKSYENTLSVSENIFELINHQDESIESLVRLTEEIVVIAEESAASTQEVAVASEQLSAGINTHVSEAEKIGSLSTELETKLDYFQVLESQAILVNE